ncbi:hypothetical protein A9Q83_18435 [Alphaproteobacteria bacterium 46_93_T64]|nr:hypothetical protein A9Q83_18435 [Alphaproteobacteria bacterium 46_93_T64]
MTYGANDRFGILLIAMQLIHDATERPPGSPGLVFLAGDMPGLVNNAARDLGRLFPRLGIGGYFLCRVAGDMAQEERHGNTLANRLECRKTGG